MKINITGNKIREEFIKFFIEKGHTFVPSSSLVPGGDQTLLFTNAGMVQFKDVFLGTDDRPYKRAVNSQKCMRVSGKHNDLDDVGRDDYHHTFFEMLGNWSFGDYYKKEAISWAWEILTEVWGLDKSNIWVTCFKDEKGEIPTDEEAAKNWDKQPGIDPNHIVYFGRKDNFWEMAEIGPCGPCSEIHFDRGEKYCDKKDDPNHHCHVNGDCHRFLELWNLVFIQYNRMGPNKLDQLPACHVDTGMGFERIVSVIQNVDSNYRTDLLMPLINVVMEISGQTEEEREKHFTPYRVIADHCRAASFLIADGVVPGNVGRNYICRMIIRRAARFGSKIGLDEPFLGQVAKKVIELYGKAYPELKKNQNTIIDNLTREENKFKSTVEGGLSILETYISSMAESDIKELRGDLAFDLYATHGLPLEITKDVLVENGFDVNQKGFYDSMEEHRLSSGAGKEFGPLGGEDAEFYSEIASALIKEKLVNKDGITVDPYSSLLKTTEVISLIKDSNQVSDISEGDEAEIITRSTNFYIESGGQVSDTGFIKSEDGETIFIVKDVRKPALGIIVHIGEMKTGKLQVRQTVNVEVEKKRRKDIMRNHTATHILQAKLREILGEHVRQAGSLVAPDRLRFDFTHPDAVTPVQLEEIEKQVNNAILESSTLIVSHKKLDQALSEGATALFGEKYGEDVRTIAIGEGMPYSNELCGGTHVSETSDIGTFIITSEGSVAAGIRRIEAVTGRKAYEIIRKRLSTIKTTANKLECSIDGLYSSVNKLINEKQSLLDRVAKMLKAQALIDYQKAKEAINRIDEISILKIQFSDSSISIMRELADEFQKDFSDGIAVFSNIVENDKIKLIVAVSDKLTKKGFHAGKIARNIAKDIGGSGGGRSQLAQAGGKDIEKLDNVLNNLDKYIKME
jgi:alanyl-tRNA synthetase